MHIKSHLFALLIFLLALVVRGEEGFGPSWLSADQRTRQISDDDLIHCAPVYCPGQIGMTGEDTRAKLAIIEIWHGKNPKEHLLQLYPKCSLTGQAYVLAALWHFDQESFKRLAADFAAHKDQILGMSADCGLNETCSQLVKEMQKTNSTMAFKNPPLTREEISRRIRDDMMAHYEELKRAKEWGQADAGYKLENPREGIVGWTVDITPKNSKIPYSIEWGWEQAADGWHPSIPIDDITAVINEINGTPFIQLINNRIHLNILIYAESGNFYRQELIYRKGTNDYYLAPAEDKEVTRTKAIIKAAGYSGTNKLVQITSRTGPLVLWHPVQSQFWLITWNLKVFPEWDDAYKQQTGLELTDMETASGWAATCDNDGILKMVRCAEAKTIEERVREDMAKKSPKSPD